VHHRPFQRPVRFLLRRTVLIGCPRRPIIDEEYAMSDENFVFDCHAGADKTVAGNLAALSYPRVLLNFDEGPNPRLLPYGAPI
jgi:hypothetical protein